MSESLFLTLSSLALGAAMFLDATETGRLEAGIGAVLCVVGSAICRAIEKGRK